MEGHRLNGSRLAGLLAAALEEAGTRPQQVRFRRGEVLFREGDPATAFYVIERGRVRLELSTPGRPDAVIQTIGPGDLVGLSWFDGAGATWSWNAMAMMDTHTLSLDAAAVRAALLRDPGLRADVASCVASEAIRRLHAARQQLVELSAAVR